jgi:hypothetical protein
MGVPGSGDCRDPAWHRSVADGLEGELCTRSRGGSLRFALYRGLRFGRPFSENQEAYTGEKDLGHS